MDRRSQILRAAARRIARDGVRGLRVTDVAEEAGVSPGLLYYHFTDRSGLLSATLDYINDHANEVRSRSGRGDESPYDELEGQLLAELGDDEEVREDSAAWSELRALAVFEQDLQEPMRRTTATWVDEVARSVQAVQKSRQFRSAAGAEDATDPVRTATILTALVEGLSNRWLAGGLSLDEAHSLLSEATGRLVPAGDPTTTDSAQTPEETP
jgi:AcrR family transcriptional regulator|nr:TetR/AcrR family transcriptional regulator [uncultured Nocardioides sp.]